MRSALRKPAEPRDVVNDNYAAECSVGKKNKDAMGMGIVREEVGRVLITYEWNSKRSTDFVLRTAQVPARRIPSSRGSDGVRGGGRWVGGRSMSIIM